MSERPDADLESTGPVDCFESVERLYLYLDGELTEERRTAIKSHLDRCGPCVNKFDFELELRRVIADRCKDRVPEQLQVKIADAIAAERSASEGRSS